MSVLDKSYFKTEAAAFKHLEKTLWAEGVVCPHCGVIDRAGQLKGKSTRPGLWKCYGCRKQFSVTVGTVFESRHIPLHKMLQAVYLMCASKKGISAHQLHRTLEITYKSAWFLAHRIREAMRDGTLSPMGGPDSIVEADETYFGNVAGPAPTVSTRGQPFTRGGRAGPSGKRAVIALVERGGRVRSFHPETADGKTVRDIVLGNVMRESRLMTDESSLYLRPGTQFATHETVKHSAKEYVRIERKLITETEFVTRKVHTNTVEGYFSIFKRGMKGIYQHCAEKHLHRYLAEYDFRYNHRIALGIDDEARNAHALKGMVGKRLTYRTAHS